MPNIEWSRLDNAIDLVTRGVCNRVDLCDGDIKVYKVKNVVRVDIKIDEQ